MIPMDDLSRGAPLEALAAPPPGRVPLIKSDRENALESDEETQRTHERRCEHDE
jgi:hypothetical protein